MGCLLSPAPSRLDRFFVDPPPARGGGVRAKNQSAFCENTSHPPTFKNTPTPLGGHTIVAMNLCRSNDLLLSLSLLSPLSQIPITHFLPETSQHKSGGESGAKFSPPSVPGLCLWFFLPTGGGQKNQTNHFENNPATHPSPWVWRNNWMPPNQKRALC